MLSGQQLSSIGVGIAVKRGAELSNAHLQQSGLQHSSSRF